MNESNECNGRIIREIAEDMNLPISQVEDVVKHYSQFTADQIRSGSMAGVTFPYLGKFMVKPKSQQYKDFVVSLGKDMKALFKRSKDNIALVFDENEKE